MEVCEKYAEDYTALMPTDKKALIAEYKSIKVDPAMPTTWVTIHLWVQGFAHTYQQITDLVHDGLGSQYLCWCPQVFLPCTGIPELQHPSEVVLHA